MERMIKIIARITRRFHPRGTERLLRLIHNPDTTKGIRTVVPYDGCKIYIDTSSFVEWFIFFKGNIEPEITNLIKQYLPKGGVFVDVGANIGTHTLSASKIASKVIAIEPVPEIAKRLKNNCNVNDITNVEIVQCAVSDKEGEFPLYISATANQGQNSLYEEGAESDDIIRVRTRTLDSICDGTQVDMIKIDAEGHDRNILMSAKGIIEKWHPVIIYEDHKKRASQVSDENINEILSSYKRIELGDYNVLCVYGKDRK